LPPEIFQNSPKSGLTIYTEPKAIFYLGYDGRNFQEEVLIMTLVFSEEPVIVRTERGLAIAGTRISIYEIMDLLKAQYPSKLIRDRFNLTSAQITAALSYIEANHTEVEAEYQEVLRTRQEIHQYWQERNKANCAQLVIKPHKSEKESL
jgi:uncharacterized protein (DUF433 family)